MNKEQWIEGIVTPLTFRAFNRVQRRKLESLMRRDKNFALLMRKVNRKELSVSDDLVPTEWIVSRRPALASIAGAVYDYLTAGESWPAGNEDAQSKIAYALLAKLRTEGLKPGFTTVEYVAVIRLTFPLALERWLQAHLRRHQ